MKRSECLKTRDEDSTASMTAMAGLSERTGPAKGPSDEDFLEIALAAAGIHVCVCVCLCVCVRVCGCVLCGGRLREQGCGVLDVGLECADELCQRNKRVFGRVSICFL